MFRLLENKLVGWAGVLFVILLFNALLSYRAVSRLWDNEQKIIHSYEVLAELRQTMSLLQDAETGQRGYLLTGREIYLKPYRAGIAQTSAHLQKLRDLTQDNPQQQALITQLNQLAQLKLNELQTTVILYQQHQPAAARHLVLTNQGQQYMTGIRQVVTQMQGEEHSLLERRAAASQVSRRAATITFIAISLLAAMLLSVFLFQVTRSIQERSRLLLAEQNARAELEVVFRSEQQARAQAEAANRLKDEFLATVSHELRTPLNAILGWIRMIRSGRLEPAASERALEAVERNAQMQAQLIEDLLDVSRIVAGKMRLDVRTVELGPVIAAALDAVRPAAEARQLRLQTILDPKAGPVSGDPARLQQVLWNLLSNAIKFTPKGGRVQLRLERVNSHVEIIISDTGEGVSPDFLPYMFEQFRQADGSLTRTHGGLGLGLAIVRRLVEMHGGTIQAESPGLGLGTTFTVCLPLLALRAPQPALDGMSPGTHPAAEANSDFDAVPLLHGVSVLVVDDQTEAAEMMTAILTQHGARTRAANSAQEALSLLDEWQPDVLVADIGMPGTDGYALIEAIRARTKEQGGTIPAVALTAYTRVEDRMRALATGFQMHVAKPVEPAELAAVVASLVARTN